MPDGHMRADIYIFISFLQTIFEQGEAQISSAQNDPDVCQSGWWWGWGGGTPATM